MHKNATELQEDHTNEIIGPCDKQLDHTLFENTRGMLQKVEYNA